MVSAQLKTKIFLTGFRGSGKTTLAKMLAEKLGFELIEMDKIIVGRAGKSIAELTKEGKKWDNFRNLENEVLKDIIKKEKIVVATGGGLFVNDVEFSKASPERSEGRVKMRTQSSSLGMTFGEYNYNLVKDLPEKFIIFLKVDEKALKERLKRGESENYNKNWRPSLVQEEIYRQRLPLYEKRSDYVVETSNQTTEKSLNEIITFLKKA